MSSEMNSDKTTESPLTQATQSGLETGVETSVSVMQGYLQNALDYYPQNFAQARELVGLRRNMRDMITVSGPEESPSYRINDDDIDPAVVERLDGANRKGLLDFVPSQADYAALKWAAGMPYESAKEAREKVALSDAITNDWVDRTLAYQPPSLADAEAALFVTQHTVDSLPLTPYASQAMQMYQDRGFKRWVLPRDVRPGMSVEDPVVNLSDDIVREHYDKPVWDALSEVPESAAAARAHIEHMHEVAADVADIPLNSGIRGRLDSMLEKGLDYYIPSPRALEEIHAAAQSQDPEVSGRALRQMNLMSEIQSERDAQRAKIAARKEKMDAAVRSETVKQRLARGLGAVSMGIRKFGSRMSERMTAARSIEFEAPAETAMQTKQAQVAAEQVATRTVTAPAHEAKPAPRTRAEVKEAQRLAEQKARRQVRVARFAGAMAAVTALTVFGAPHLATENQSAPSGTVAAQGEVTASVDHDGEASREHQPRITIAPPQHVVQPEAPTVHEVKLAEGSNPWVATEQELVRRGDAKPTNTEIAALEAHMLGMSGIKTEDATHLKTGTVLKFPTK